MLSLIGQTWSLVGIRKVRQYLCFQIYEGKTDRADTPLKPEYSLRQRLNHLRLFGGCYPLSSPEAPTMLLRKQTALSQYFGTKLDFQPSRAGYEAGVVVWWSMYSYASAGITRSPVNDFLYAVFRSPLYEKYIPLVCHLPLKFFGR
jgi:hypothetical protein